MPDCDRCGAFVLELAPDELLALVPVENLDHARAALASLGRPAWAFLCPVCNRCGFTTDTPLADRQVGTQ
mgnify:CR=1 FL=1|jgi:hypothetical protein